MKNKIVLLTVILLIALGLRINSIRTLPALNADEAAIGYNAYSLLETGKDEFGQPWPLVFTSFGDYKPGVYFYLVMPFIKVLGLNVLAVRLPAIIISVASIGVLYGLITELSKHKKFPYGEALGLVASLVLAIHPWHIHFSRGGWETQVATGMVTAGVWLFIKGIKYGRWLLGSVLLFVLALYTYHSMRIVAPLLGITLLGFYWKDLWKTQTKWLLRSAIIGFIFLIPFMGQLTSESGLSRAQGVSIFADDGPIWRVNELRSYQSNPNSTAIKLLHNKVVTYGFRFVSNYVSHFSGHFLFLEGDIIERNRVPGFGQLYLVWLPILLVGLVWALRNPVPGNRIFLAWLLIAPLPAALTFQSPHAVRAFSMTIPLAYFTAAGYWGLWQMGQRVKWSAAPYMVIVGLMMISTWDVCRYLFNYYNLMTAWYPYSSQYGLSELVPWVESVKNNYQEVWITDRYDQPYILFLFYSQYPAHEFQKQAILSARDTFGFSTVRQYDNYRFKSISYQELVDTYFQGSVLVIGTDEEIPDSTRVIKEIHSDHNKIIFQAAEL